MNTIKYYALLYCYRLRKLNEKIAFKLHAMWGRTYRLRLYYADNRMVYPPVTVWSSSPPELPHVGSKRPDGRVLVSWDIETR